MVSQGTRKKGGKNHSKAFSLQNISFSLVAKLCPTLATPWTVACQAPLSMGFSRQEYWSGLPFPSPGDLAHPGTEPTSPTLQAFSVFSELPRKPLLWMRNRLREVSCHWALNQAIE